MYMYIWTQFISEIMLHAVFLQIILPTEYNEYIFLYLIHTHITD